MAASIPRKSPRKRTNEETQGNTQTTGRKVDKRTGKELPTEDPPEKKKKRKSRPGMKAIREIIKYQGGRTYDRGPDGKNYENKTYVTYPAGTDLQIPKAAIQRLVYEVARDYKSDLRFTEMAMDAIHHVIEGFLTDVLIDTNLQAIGAGA